MTGLASKKDHCVHNLLTEPLIRVEKRAGVEHLSLPEIFAELIADGVESFPVLRPHQHPAWHSFLTQLGALACHGSGLSTPPQSAAEWLTIIRNLTSDFPNDEPWQLIVADDNKPAFMQPPVPEGTKFTGDDVITPDALDMLITSKNHDIKLAVAADNALDDWIFALVSLQTCEGYNGAGNHGIARMNGGSSSRMHLGLVPMRRNSTVIRPGVRLRRDITQLLWCRDKQVERYSCPASGAPSLIWTTQWPEGQKLQLKELDIWFIEICRRVRLKQVGDWIVAKTGTSSSSRIEAKEFSGVTGDPWAPVTIEENNKALTLSENRTFNYHTIVELLSGDWDLPPLAQLGSDETVLSENWQLIAQAFARGNSKTYGFHQRVIPLTGFAARGLMDYRSRLHEVAVEQIKDAEKVGTALRNGIALAAAGGDQEKVKKDHYAQARPTVARLEQHGDQIFFPALWARFEDRQKGVELSPAREAFVRELKDVAEHLLDEGLANIPCRSIHRPRAEARARRRFYVNIAKDFEMYFRKNQQKEAADAAAEG